MAVETFSILTLVGAFALLPFGPAACLWQELLTRTTATSINNNFFIVQMFDFAYKGRAKLAVFRVRFLFILYQFYMQTPK
jgi:hypothetical protein